MVDSMSLDNLPAPIRADCRSRFNGYKVRVSDYCPRVATFKRSWRDRLFSWPWRPSVKDEELPAVFWMYPDTLIVHPSTVIHFR